MKMNHRLQLKHRKIWAVIPAAGSGSRFSRTELKQYQRLQQKTVLEHTVERLNQLPLAGYVLAISAQDKLAPSLNLAHRELAHFCIGGDERVHSVLNALKYLESIADPDDWVMVHDAARPCVSFENLENLVQTAINESCSAILAIPVRDTLKMVATHQQIEKTVSREHLWQAQTPQISTLQQLKGAIEHALQHHLQITDEASALEFADIPVKVVAGRSDNIKITYPEDLLLADLILTSQQNYNNSVR